MQSSTDTLFMLPIIPLALSSAEHILSFFLPSDYLHEDLHLNGCGKYINNTYTNNVKAAQYLFVAARHEWGKKIQ